MFGETGVDAILAEIENCHKAHPVNHVGLLGFDSFYSISRHVNTSSPRRFCIIA